MSSELLSPGLAGRTLTYFGLGGSGIRAVEPLLHLCALGLGPAQLRLVLIDPDEANAAVTRTRRLIDLYRQAWAALKGAGTPEGYFRTQVVDAIPGSLLWSPIADDRNLPDARFAARVDASLLHGQRTSSLGHLFDLLFASRFQEMDLGMGFRGVPSIGTVFMNRLRDQQFFEQLLTDAQQQADSVFFAAGSIFGGTGAAAFPVVGRALTDGLRGMEGRPEIPGVARRRVSGAILLPYFTLPAPAGREGDAGPRPETALFAQNAAAAIPAYTQDQAGYGSYYVLGDGEPREQEHNEVGGERQANRAHYVELFAALAALDFAAHGGEKPEQALPVFRTIAVRGQNVSWPDLPMDEASRRRLMGGIVAAHTFLRVFRPDGRPRAGLAPLLKGATWLEELKMSSAELQAGSRALDLMGEFYLQTWNWLEEMRGSRPALQLACTNSRPPTAVRLDEVIDGRRGSGRTAPVNDDFEIFRHWNLAARDRRRTGFGGFLEVLREGSERFVDARFNEAA
ncbi:MAG TPA: hypothetical protein VF092_17145 [Longimicrobium sp.]